VLAKLGPEACERALVAFAELGYHGRNAACRALAAIPANGGRRLELSHVRRAMQITIGYAETLHGLDALAGDGLLRREIRHRIAEVGDRVLDLAAALADRALVAKARAGLHGGVRSRSNALELLENVLPRALAARTVALLERAPAGTGPVAGGVARAAPRVAPFTDEGWLESCRRFDAGEIWYEDPMRPVLEKLVLLHGCTLFGGLSGEELYPVAEIAELVTKSPGETVVRKGDPGDALFVMVAGTVAVLLGGQRAHELGRGAAFGEMALLDGEPRSATIEAVTDAELLRIPREEFDALIDESPALARGVIRTLISHVRARG
jgi:signal-transduction protein with cAMP-binding, CBS, and nucleotidyltransferase domain